MPRENRISRAMHHANSLTGCIMLVQEGIRFMCRSVARWSCPELEEELRWLQEEHNSLQILYQSHEYQFQRYQQRLQTRLARYREEIHNLLFVNARRLSSHSHQTLAFRAEIAALRNTVRSLNSTLSSIRSLCQNMGRIQQVLGSMSIIPHGNCRLSGLIVILRNLPVMILMILFLLNKLFYFWIPTIYFCFKYYCYLNRPTF